MDDVTDKNVTISPTFIQQIRDLLEHLYDFPYLQRQTLVLPLAETGQQPIEVPGQRARKLLLDALEKIGEEKNLPFRSSQTRIYNLLRLHYIEGMAVHEVARELDLSQRQTYRDLRSGDEHIASILWTNLINRQPVAVTLVLAGAVPESVDHGVAQPSQRGRTPRSMAQDPGWPIAHCHRRALGGVRARAGARLDRHRRGARDQLQAGGSAAL